MVRFGAKEGPEITIPFRSLRWVGEARPAVGLRNFRSYLHTRFRWRGHVTSRERLAAVGVVEIMKNNSIAGPVDGPDGYVYLGHACIPSFRNVLRDWPLSIAGAREFLVIRDQEIFQAKASKNLIVSK